MTTFLISYDLSKPGRNYDELIEHLKGYGTYSHSLESVWIIVTDLSAKQVRDAAMKHVDANDKVLVVKAGPEGAWRGLRTSTGEWLQKYL